MRKIVLSIIMLLVIISAANAGPFGIEFGMSLEEVKKVANILGQSTTDKYMYFINPYKTSNLISNARICISQKYGVFEIAAVGNHIISDVYGDKIKYEFKKFVELITKTYGEPTNIYDYLKEGSIWNQPNEWLTSLRKMERYYQYYWILDNDINNPNAIDYISLYINFKNENSNECWIVLVYQSNIYKVALKDATQEENVF